MLRRYLFLIVCLFNWTDIHAQNTPPDEEYPRQSDVTTSSQSNSNIVKLGHMHLNVYAGRYDASYEPQFVGVRKKYGLGIGLSVDTVNVNFLSLAIDLELFLINREYDTPIGPPLWGTIDNDTSVLTSAILFGGRIFYPPAEKLRVYASAGLGLFRTKMVVYGSVFGLPGSYEDNDTSLNPYLGMGLGYMVNRWGMSVDIRHFTLNGDFNAFNIRDAQLGGNLVLFGWQYKM